MPFEQKETSQTITWLDFYGLLREAGESTPFQVQEFLDGGSQVLNESIAATEAAAEIKGQERRATTEYVGTALTAIGVAVITAAGESVIGAVVGAVIAAIGVIIGFLARIFTIECDKYHCGGYDQKTRLEKAEYLRHKQALVGVNPGDKKSWDIGGDCSCSREQHHCAFVRFMNDGLIVDGIEFANLTSSGTTKVGRVRGANAITTGGNAGCVEYWRNHGLFKPLDANGKDIPKGQYTDPHEAFKNAKDSYYYRAWKVREVLWWMQDHVLCRTMECMEEAIENAPATDDDSADNQKRRRGSRWYASIVWMTKDLWYYGQKIGWDKLEKFMREVGVHQLALDALQKMRRGDVFEQKDLPFEWWPLTAHMTFMQIREILIKMKPLFPYERRTPTMPEGQAAREINVDLKQLMLPIRTPVIYGRDMRPVPAKIGRRGPGASAIILGTTAAIVGGYAIYKLMER